MSTLQDIGLRGLAGAHLTIVEEPVLGLRIARPPNPDLHSEVTGHGGRGKGADVTEPVALCVPVKNGVTEKFQRVLRYQHDRLPVGGGIFAEHCLILGKVSDGGDK